MARLPHGLHLVELEQTGSGAEQVLVCLPLVDRLSVHQNPPAAGAGRREIHVGEDGRRRLGVLRQGESGADPQLLLSEPEPDKGSVTCWTRHKCSGEEKNTHYFHNSRGLHLKGEKSCFNTHVQYE